MSARARLALAALCALLALAACLALLYANREPATFSALVTLAPVPQSTPSRIHAPPRSGAFYSVAKVDVNTADEAALLSLNGIGPALAQAILTERDSNGAFHYPEDMMAVKGIGEKKLAGMMDQLRFPAQPTLP